MVDIKLVKQYFTVIFHENMPGEKLALRCQLDGVMV